MKRILHLLAVVIIASTLVLSGCDVLPTPAVKVLNLAGNEPITLDPAISGEASSHQFITQLFSGLMRLDDDLNPVPDIAESYEISPDGRTYTFKLKENAKFQDGKGVKAGDFKYSWERACFPETGSGTAVTYLGDVVGVLEMLSGKVSALSGVRVVSDYILEVTIDAPKSYFLSKLTYPTTFVVDKSNVERGGEWWRKPNGTGPFKLKDWQERKTIVLEKNSLYYGTQAKVDSVVFQFYAGVPIDLYETGRVDAADVYASYIDKASDKTGPFLSDLKTEPELSFYYIGFNASKPPFDDPDIRQAFSTAIDKEKLVSIIFHNTVKPAYGILPPGIPGYNPNLEGLKFDVSKARELIAKSKYGDVSKLPPITITTSGYGGLISSDLEATIAELRQNLGVEIMVRQLEPERFIYNLKDELDEMYDMGWIADYPHPQDFLDILFRSGADYNYGEYSNSTVDNLLVEAASTKDSAASLAIYRDIEQKLVSDAACLPLWFGENYYLVKPYVSGFKVNPLGLISLNTVSIE